MTDRILVAAGEVFLSQGFQAATMDAIAARLGGSKRTLYSRFRSKTDLFRQVVERHRGGFEASFDLVAERDQGLRDLLSATGRLILARAVHPDTITLLQLVLTERDRFPDLADAIALEPQRAATAFLAPHFRRAGGDGLLPAVDPVRLAEQFVILVLSRDVHRVLVGVGAPGMTAERARWVDDVVSVFLRDARRAPAREPAAGRRLLIGADDV